MALLCAWLIGMLCAAFRGVVMWRSCVPMRTQRRAMICSGNFRPSLHQRKPDWVRREIIRLRAYSPDLGCRKLADAFNRQFSAAKRMTVGKSYVAAVLRTNRSEVAYLRRTIKHRVPRPLPRNRLWAMGLSTVTDTTTRQRLVLGLIDHGTRARLRLPDLADKRSMAILGELIATFRCLGVPKIIRTDNEACFVSATMHTALMLLGVRLQHTDVHCPWQNGRIERLFGTLKAQLAKIFVTGTDDLALKLIEFRAWYNHARPHQHLGFRTPAEAWEGR